MPIQFLLLAVTLFSGHLKRVIRRRTPVFYNRQGNLRRQDQREPRNHENNPKQTWRDPIKKLRGRH